MTLTIFNSGITALTNYLIETNSTVIQEFSGVEEVDYLEVCDFLGYQLDQLLEEQFDTFICLNHLSYAENKDWIIDNRGIKELTEYLNINYETTSESELCMYLKQQLDAICTKLLGFDNILAYID